MRTVYVNFNPGMDVAAVVGLLASAGFTRAQTPVDVKSARCIRVDLGAWEMELLIGRAFGAVDIVTLMELGHLIKARPAPEKAPPINDELRDRIAIAAMATLTGDPDTVAMNAYKIANAMLKAREATR